MSSVHPAGPSGDAQVREARRLLSPAGSVPPSRSLADSRAASSTRAVATASRGPPPAAGPAPDRARDGRVVGVPRAALAGHRPGHVRRCTAGPTRTPARRPSRRPGDAGESPALSCSSWMSNPSMTKPPRSPFTWNRGPGAAEAMPAASVERTPPAWVRCSSISSSAPAPGRIVRSSACTAIDRAEQVQCLVDQVRAEVEQRAAALGGGAAVPAALDRPEPVDPGGEPVHRAERAVGDQPPQRSAGRCPTAGSGTA